MSIGTFTLIKNEIHWLKEHIENVAPHLDQMVFFDGNSTDGTLEMLYSAKEIWPHIKIVENKDPKDLKDDYVRLFNECMRTLATNWAFFLHPDMWIENPKRLRVIRNHPGVSMSTRMISYAGDPALNDDLYRIETGRADRWKNIYRLREPDLGAHYHGWYGAANEDVYFSKITGDFHHFHGIDFSAYPYEVADSGLRVHHFSDVRPYARRFGRMRKCLMNQGYPSTTATRYAKIHPRVTLFDDDNFKFIRCTDPRRVKKVHATA